MALSYVKYTANGSTNQFAVTFSYISASDVYVYINGVADSSYTFVNSALVQTSSTPANGAIVEVRRQTSNTARLVDFQDGSVLTESDLDASANQNFFTVQENFDRTQDTIQLTALDVFDAQAKRITNVANPTSDQDVATKHYLENTWLTTANKTALTTVNANIANINAVNSNASNVNSAVANASNINTVAGSISNVNTVGGIASNVTTVAGITSNIASAVSNASNITTVANNIGSVNTVATDIAKVIAVANDLAEAVSEVETVADDLNEATSEIDTVATNIANVNTVGGISGNVTTVAGIASNVTTVAGISSAVTGVNNIASAVSAVNSNSSNINAVNSNASNINTVAGAVSNVNTVGGDIANVNTVAGITSNVTTVAGISADVTAVANKTTEIVLLGTSAVITDLGILGTSDVVNDMNVLGTTTNVSNMNTLEGISSDITTVAGMSSNVSTVAGIASNVTTVAGANSNITAVAGNASNINTVGGAITNVNNVGGSIANVNTVASNLASVNAFGEAYRVGSSNPTSSLDVGDLFYNTTDTTLKVYDGTGWTAGVTAGSGFLPLTGGGLTGALTTNSTVDGRDIATDGTKLDGIEASATADQTGAEIKSAYEGESDTNAFTDALQTKLNGIETSATADQTKSDIDALNINADTLDGQHGSYYTTYTDTAVSNLVDSSPSALNTLNELASALGDDANFSTTVNNNIATKLPLSGGAMTGNITHGDNVKATFGASNDLEIYHDGTNSFIKDVGTGGLYLRGDTVLGLGVGSETGITCNINGSVDIMYDDVKKFETTSNGCEITGQLIVSNDLKLPDNSELRIGSATNGDFLIYHDGSNSYIDNQTGELRLKTSTFKFMNANNSETMISASENGAVNLYYDNGKKFETTSSGVTISGTTTSSGNTIGDGFIHRVGGTDIGLVTSSGNNLYFQNQVNDGDILIRGKDGGSFITAVSFDMSDSGSATFNSNVTAYSDERLKTNIKTIDNALDKVSQMRGVTFDRDGGANSGVIAQEFEKIAPELVKTADDEMGTKSVAYGNTVGYLIEAIKELKAEVEELKTKKECECE